MRILFNSEEPLKLQINQGFNGAVGILRGQLIKKRQYSSVAFVAALKKKAIASISMVAFPTRMLAMSTIPKGSLFCDTFYTKK